MKVTIVGGPKTPHWLQQANSAVNVPAFVGVPEISPLPGAVTDSPGGNPVPGELITSRPPSSVDVLTPKENGTPTFALVFEWAVMVGPAGKIVNNNEAVRDAPPV